MLSGEGKRFEKTHNNLCLILPMVWINYNYSFHQDVLMDICFQIVCFDCGNDAAVSFTVSVPKYPWESFPRVLNKSKTFPRVYWGTHVAEVCGWGPVNEANWGWRTGQVHRAGPAMQALEDMMRVSTFILRTMGSHGRALRRGVMDVIYDSPLAAEPKRHWVVSM